MHTLSIECSDQAYEHLLYLLRHLPQEDVRLEDEDLALAKFAKTEGFKQAQAEMRQSLDYYRDNGGSDCLDEEAYAREMGAFKERLKARYADH